MPACYDRGPLHERQVKGPVRHGASPARWARRARRAAGLLNGPVVQTPPLLGSRPRTLSLRTLPSPERGRFQPAAVTDTPQGAGLPAEVCVWFPG